MASVTILLRRLLLGAGAALALALAVLVALTLSSRDNGPYMTPIAITLVALITALVLAAYAGGLAEAEADERGRGNR